MKENPDKKRRKILSGVLSATLCLGVVAISFPVGGNGQHEEHWKAPLEAVERQTPVPRDNASVERGKQLFVKNCAICHGNTGRGDGPASKTLNPKPPDLAEEAGHHSDGELAWKIANGRGPMPGWEKTLSENDIWDLTNFIQSLRP